MSIQRVQQAVLLAILLFAACGQEDPTDLRAAQDPSPGACVDVDAEMAQAIAAGDVDAMPVWARVLREDVAWVSASGVTVDEEQASETTAVEGRQMRPGPRSVALVAPSAMRGSRAPERVEVDGPSIGQLRDAAAEHGSVLMSVDATNRVDLIAVEGGDGDAVFVGSCQEPLATQPWTKIADRLGRPGWSLLTDAVADPGGEAGLALRAEVDPQPVAWQDLDPSQRSIDPLETPKEVMAALQSVVLDIRIPESWMDDDDTTICTRSAIAWNDCAAFSATVDGGVQIAAYFEAGKDLELWFLDGEATFAGRSAKLQAIPAALVTEAATTGRMLRLVPTSDADAPVVWDRAGTGDAFRAEVE